MWTHQRKPQRKTEPRVPARPKRQVKKSVSMLHDRTDRTGIRNKLMSGQGRAAFNDTRIRYSTGQSGQMLQRVVHSSFLPDSYADAAAITEVSDAVQNYFRQQRGEDWQRLTRPSEILRASLRIDGHVPDSNHWGSDENVRYTIENQAHHIVETSNVHGNDILLMAGIDPNSAANGVFLPTYSYDATGDATLHSGSHVGEYQNCINSALNSAITGVQPGDEYRGAVLSILQRIRNVLLTCNVPINRHVDATYSDESQGSETITQIFRREGLF